MFSFPLLLILAVGVAVLLLILSSQRSKPAAQPLSYPYEKQPALFTPAERSFLGVLERALSGEYKVFGKVNLADVVKVRRGLSKGERQSALNRISRKHLDFVICRGDTLDLVCAIELDDKSHGAKARKGRDAFLDEALAAAGVPIVRFPTQRTYELAEVRAKLSGVLADNSVQSSPDQIEEQDKENSVSSEQICPKCGAELVVRTAKRGKNVGQEFLACSAYPSCKTTLALN